LHAILQTGAGEHKISHRIDPLWSQGIEADRVTVLASGPSNERPASGDGGDPFWE
jgi:hypothetical protein